METTLTSKGQVTIPKRIRDSLRLTAGSKIVFDVSEDGKVFFRKPGASQKRPRDRFDRAVGAAEIKLNCSTDEYMETIRGYRDDPA
jgi:AbrB family looped-hinge helix DNA binding protein